MSDQQPPRPMPIDPTLRMALVLEQLAKRVAELEARVAAMEQERRAA